MVLRWLYSPAPEYHLVSRVFLRALALIYLAAFASLATQMDGLAGSEGLLPLGSRLGLMLQQIGNESYWRMPNLFWVYSGDAALTGATWSGCVFAVLLLFNRLPRLSLIALFALYLSLFHAGQIFMNFQWDYLLLEAGFLAILLSLNASRLVVWLFHWLLFRLRFESGISKLISGDASWADLGALQYYFETQPLPHWGAWFAHQLPDWLLRTGAGFVLAAELLVPFLMFLPRRFRLVAAWVTLLTQLLIVATSNHNFFNLLTMALCLFLFDDRALARVLPARGDADRKAETRPPAVLYRLLSVALAAVIVATSTVLMWEMISGRRLPDSLASAVGYVRAFGLAQRYHVFPTIRTERLELVIEGSADGALWKPYGFRYKPQDPGRRPAFIVPHQPRLDWMMWFVTINLPLNAAWLEGLVHGLFTNAPAVTGLLASNPFAESPPRMIRAQVYRYRFTSRKERAATGHWWHRELVGSLIPFPWFNPRSAPPPDAPAVSAHGIPRPGQRWP